MSVSPARTVIAVLAILALASALGWYYSRERGVAPQAPVAGRVQQDRSSPPTDAGTQGGSAPVGQQAAHPAPSVEAAATPQVAPAAAPPRPPEQQQAKKDEAAAEAKPPSFDVVRVEPTGESVIAGRAAPGATVELLRNGQSFARVVADASGLFAFVPPPLPTGSHEIVLQANKPDGAGRIRSAQSVTVVIASDRKQVPLVTVTAPDQPTVVLSRPDEPASQPEPSATTVASTPTPRASSPGKPAEQRTAAVAPAAPAKRPDIRIAAVEAEGTGRLFVSGSAAPGATVRLYLNDAFVAPGSTGSEGRLSFSIERGIKPGDYKVRLDDVDPVTGAVKSRAEVPFTVPASPSVTVAGAPVGRASDGAGPGIPGGSSPGGARASRPGERSPTTSEAGVPPQASAPGRVAAADTEPRAAAGTGAAILSDPGQVVVPEVNTAIVARGDNLWRISKRVYGRGLRYTVIYGANTPQIRDPNLIYPGQVFVLPADTAQTR